MKQLPQPTPEKFDNKTIDNNGSKKDEKLSQQVADNRQPPAKRSRKKWIYLGLSIMGGLAIAWALRPTPIAVNTARVEPGELRVTVNAEGKTRVRDRYIVSADVAGRLERVQFQEGDTVRAGAIVAHIDSLPLNTSIQKALAQLAEWRAERTGVATKRPKVATLDQAQMRIRAARANQSQAAVKVAGARAALAQAQRDRQRAQDLAASGAIARRDRETAELTETIKAKELEATTLAAKAALADVEVAQAALTVLQKEQRDPDYLLRVYDARIASMSAELAKLQADAQRTTLRSPVSGRILKIRQESAQYVAEGTPILEIADPGKLEVVIDVLSSDALKIEPGDPILVNQGVEAAPLRAQVRLVEPAAFTKVSALGVEEQRVNVIGDFADTTQLGDAYRVDVQVVVWQGEKVLQAPLSALFRCERTNWCAFVVKAGRVDRQPVAIGQRSDLAAEIRQGLKVGDVVVLHPTEQIKAGSSVSPR